MKLKEWRVSKGWTQQRLAKEIDRYLIGKRAETSDAHIRKWEGGTEPGWSVGEAISKISRGRVKPEGCRETPIAPECREA